MCDGPGRVSAADDRRHPGRGAAALFGRHRLDALSDDGRSALVCQVSISGGEADYLAAIVDVEQSLVVVPASKAAGSVWIPDGLTPWLTTLSVDGVRSERRSPLNGEIDD